MGGRLYICVGSLSRQGVAAPYGDGAEQQAGGGVEQGGEHLAAVSEREVLVHEGGEGGETAAEARDEDEAGVGRQRCG